VFKLLRDFAVEEFFSYESLNARKEEKSSTDELPTRFAVEFFLSYKLLKSRKRRIFLPTSYIQGQVRESQGSPRVHQGWSITTRRGHEEEKKRKKTKEGKKVAPAKARFRVPYTKNSFFFGSQVFGFGSSPSWLKYRLLRFFTRKPCAKEVPETDYLMQQKQYLKRTTLCTY
jgi:hypothetical protein